MFLSSSARRSAAISLILLLAAIPAGAFALITGGEGNDPISDPGWPAGAAKIFNDPARVAWWEGPPLGGGQWHAEYRGEAAELNALLADFAKVDAKVKRIVVHDGVGHSFWLNPNREAEKKDAAQIDWLFMVWRPASFERLRTLPVDLNPIGAGDAKKGPPSQIDIYTGGKICWADVKLPRGIEVDDRRLEAHGFKPADGRVLEGRVVDLATGKPLAARMVLQLVEPQKEGGYKYTQAAEAKTDAKGRWVLKNAPAGWHRVVIESEGYVPRVLGYMQADDQPSWHSYDGGLARPASVSGQVTDSEGKPLADVTVRLGDVAAASGGSYASSGEHETKTDAEGRFRFERTPAGTASVWIHKAGYVRPGLGEKITAPAKDLALKMIQSATLRVTVDFVGMERPAGYIVNVEPVGGLKVGSWGGSGQINSADQMLFEQIPPGKYIVSGQPNPGSEKEKTKPVTVELKGGETTELTISRRVGI